ncbi:MAG: hypothetical protein JZU64_15580, partial [Rhodoferax sp.]|nr:hypothetical protein [Rhodoferax sp.]
MTIGSNTSIAGPISVYANTINVNANLSSTLSGADVLLKASGNISLGSSKTITTTGGDVTFWSDSDGNGTGYVQMSMGSAVTTGGGAITLGGGTDITTGYARGEATFDRVTEPLYDLYISGVNLQSGTSLTSGGGDIILRGQTVNTSASVMSFGVMGGGVTVDSGVGKISIYGKATGSASVNAQAISSYGSGYTLRSANTTAQAIMVEGDASAVNGTSTSLGINFAGSIEATGTGGGISITGKSGTAAVDVATGLGGSSVLAKSGPITIRGVNDSANLAISGQGATIGFKSGSSVPSSSSDITFIGDLISYGSATVQSSGTLTLKPYTANTTIGVGTGTGSTWTVANSLFSGTSVFKDGFSSIVIGASDAGHITVGGANSFVDNVTLLTGSNITLNSGATITGSQNSGYIALAATGNFINNGGASALSTTGASSRWLVYSVAPNNDVFGSLDSANGAVWNASYATMAPSTVTATGNRYLFTGTPSVTVTASATKIYGTTLTASDVLGLSSSSGSSPVYTLPTLADVFSVNPTVTSLGLAATASVSGGPYAITVAPGTSSGSYTITYATPGTITVTPKALSVSGATASNKVYDATTSAVLTGGTLVGVVNNDVLTLVQAGTFASANVGTGIVVTAANTITGAAVNNYTLTQPIGLSANITKKALTITANNDARFAGQTDAIGYYGVSYVGFASGESSSNLSTLPTIARSNSSVGTAGSYTGVLEPSGAAATNYSFSYVNGNYTIVGANELLVRLGTVSNVYATTPSYSVTEAKYMLPNNGVVDLLNTGAGSASVSGAGQVTVTDTSGASATFNAVALNGTYSTSGWLNVGTYQWTADPASVVLSSGVNFNNTVNVVGSQTVTTKFFAPTPTISKVYDGTTTIAGLSGTPIGVVTGDVVTISGAGAYANKNVGTNKTYTLSNMALSGTDAANYGLTTGSSLTVSNGTVAAKAITVTGIAANDKVYDGTNTATLNEANAVFNGMVAGDALTVAATGTYGSANVVYSGAALAAQVVAFTSTYGGADVNNYSFAGSPTTTTAKITPKSLTLTGVAANDKTYDGGVVATIANFGTLTGVLAGDAANVSLVTLGASATFADKNVAYSGSTVNAKTVTLTASSLGLSGTKAGNYAIVGNLTASAKINPKAVTVSGIAANDKVYDATTSATVSTTNAVFNGQVTGDDVHVSATGVFAAKDAGTARTVNLSSSYNGTDLANYTVTDQANTTAAITPKALTVSGFVANNRVYDGGLTATVDASNVFLAGLISGDVLTASATGVFANKNVGTAKTVTLTNSYAGADKDNYTITDQATSTANITPKALTISGITAADKTYDNTTAATVSVSGAVKTGLVLNDVVNVAATGVFSDENAATGKTVTLTSSYSGADVGNYTVTSQPSTTARIVPLDVQLPADASLSKVYDATTSVAPALSGNATGYGSLAVTSANSSQRYTDALAADQLVSGGMTLTGRPVFSSADAGTVLVDQGSVQLTGSRAANYRLVWAATSATITPAPLTVTANNDARFYSLADDPTYAGVRYSGFVGGETSAVLSVTAVVTRDRTGLSGADALDAASSTDYVGKLVPSGVTSNNYSITFVNGNYTIVPVGQLLVKVADTNATYGSTPTYNLTYAGYMSDSGSQTYVVTDLLASGYATVSGTQVTVTDGSVTKGSFTLGANSPALSSSGTLKVGSYSVGATAISTTSANFSNTINVVGAYDVTPKSVTTSATGVTKVYDGNTSAGNYTLAPVGLEASDVVSLTGVGTYANKNVTGAADKTYTFTSLALGGADAANYVLTDGTSATTTYTDTNGVITPRTLTANYTGVNKVYDGVLAATVTTTDNRVAGDTLTISRSADFDSKNVGTAKAISVSGVSLGGTDAINYTVAATGSTSADITPRALTINYTGINKVYDAGTTATVTTADDRVAGDNFIVNWTANYADKNVAGGKAITVTGVSLSDPAGVTSVDAGNY